MNKEQGRTAGLNITTKLTPAPFLPVLRSTSNESWEETSQLQVPQLILHRASFFFFLRQTPRQIKAARDKKKKKKKKNKTAGRTKGYIMSYHFTASKPSIWNSNLFQKTERHNVLGAA